MENALFLFMFGGMEIFLLIFMVLLLFGGKKIPELMRGIGKGITEFNSARDALEEEDKSKTEDNE